MKVDNIDLSLAINYIPACSCLARLLCYLAVQGATDLYADHRLVVVLGTLLYMDRVLQNKGSFFDSNAIIYTVYFAHIFQYVRGVDTQLYFSVLLVYFCSGLLSLFYLWDHPCMMKIANKLLLPLETIQVWICILPVLYLLFSATQEEIYACYFCKAVCFAVLVIVWIYVIGLKYSRLNSQAFVVRFLPILILPIYMAVVHIICCVFIIFVHLRQNLMYSEEPPKAESVQTNEVQQEDDIEAMFRMAKAVIESNNKKQDHNISNP